MKMTEPAAGAYREGRFRPIVFCLVLLSLSSWSVSSYCVGIRFYPSYDTVADVARPAGYADWRTAADADCRERWSQFPSPRLKEDSFEPWLPNDPGDNGYGAFSCYTGRYHSSGEAEVFGGGFIYFKCVGGDQDLYYDTGICSSDNVGVQACRDMVGNPIAIATGNKVQIEHDYIYPRDYRLNISRYYNSDYSMAYWASGVDSQFGPKWRSTFDQRVDVVVYRGSETVYTSRPSGAKGAYRLLAGQWVPVGPSFGVLEEVLIGGVRSGWRLVRPSGEVESYDNAGQLAKLAQSGRPDLEFTYGVGGRLESVRTVFGDGLAFEYLDQRVVAIVTPTGRLAFDYDEKGNLKSVVYPSDVQEVPPNAAERRYLYEDPRFPHHLTGIVNEKGVVSSSWSYDDLGRAVTSEAASGISRVSLSFADNGAVTAVSPLGHVSTYRYGSVGGRKRLRAFSGVGCLGCSVDGSKFEYDAASGYLTSVEDFRLGRTTINYDKYGRHLKRVRAVGTPEQIEELNAWDAVSHLRIFRKIGMAELRYQYNDRGELRQEVVRDIGGQ